MVNLHKNGDEILWAWGIQNRISCSVDTKISAQDPESWGERIHKQTFSQDTARNAGSRDTGDKHTTGSHSCNNDNPTEVYGERGDRKDQGAEC